MLKLILYTILGFTLGRINYITTDDDGHLHDNMPPTCANNTITDEYCSRTVFKEL